MIAFKRSFGLLRTFIRPLLLVNLFYFGVVGAGMAYGSWDRDAHEAIASSITGQAPDALPAVFRAYREGHFAAAVALTFVVNLFVGSLFFITGPSLVVPFSGIVLGGVRAMIWGFIFAPSLSGVTGADLLKGLLIGVLLLLEGEGYVLAMLASYVQGKSFLFPAISGAAGHWQGYKLGLNRALQLYVSVAFTLAVAALYEATLVIWIVPLIK